ncbi:MAG: chromate transporter [Treponema sp.]|nr:MAG: chromate transporter [Treponema sp.]
MINKEPKPEKNLVYRENIKILIKLFFVFFKIGAVTFGGGLAMLPILRREIVDRLKWATDEEMLDYYVIGQSTPGIIATNVATFIGFKRFGFIGSLVASIGIVMPSVIVITVIAAFITNFSQIEIVHKAMRGINVAVAMLLTDAILNLGSKTIQGILTFLIAVAAFFAMSVLNISAIWIVLVAAALGIIIQTLKEIIKKASTKADKK